MCKECNKRQCSAVSSSDDKITSRQKQHTSAVCQEDIVEEETSHLATRWLSDRLTATRTGGARQPTSEIMQSAKKLVLVDEFDREYKRLQKPSDAVAKTNRSLQLSDTLRNQSLAEDHKVREYIAALHKYLNIRKELPVESDVKPNPLTLPPPPPPPPTRSHRRRKPRGWVPY